MMTPWDWYFMTCILAAAIAGSGALVTLQLQRIAGALEKKQP